MPKPMPVPREADNLAREVTRLTMRSPGDRSVLRHSLGQAPRDVALGVHRIVAPLVPERAPDAAERAYYAVAALIASQPRQARDQAGTDNAPEDAPDGLQPEEAPGAERAPARPRRRNLGFSLAQAAGKGASAGSLDDRLQLLARQDADGLYRHLPRLILQLRGDQVRIDWGVLIRDLTRWAGDPRQVAKEWAQDYYRTSERLAAEKKRKAGQPAGGNDNEETRS